MQTSKMCAIFGHAQKSLPHQKLSKIGGLVNLPLYYQEK